MISVVLADDHGLLREGMRRVLEKEPDLQVVGEAANGAEAVAMVQALEPDVVLMDVVMPELNGIEATKLIKVSNPPPRSSSSAPTTMTVTYLAC